MLVLAALVLLGMAACKKGGGTVHRSGSGPAAKIGEWVIYDFTLKKDGKELFSTAQSGQSAKDIISDPSKIKDPMYKFVMSSILSMKKGDSTTFVMKLDTFKIKPQGLDSAKNAEFTISLKDVMSEEKFMAGLSPQEQQGYKAQKLQMKLQEIYESSKEKIKASQGVYDAAKPVFIARAKGGIKYAVVKEGTGNVIGGGRFAFVNYFGCLKNGKKFDQSFERGSPLVFPVGIGQVIPGWDEGVALMKENSIAIFLIPANLAYGPEEKKDEKGAVTIPANSDLVFYVELLKAY
jgi:FKBP-type peptidyl-prolyl cis-trans isomerase FkpA